MPTDYPKNNIGRSVIPFTIVNNSGIGAYLYMFGTTKPLTPQNNTYWISNLKGDCTLFKPNEKLTLGVNLGSTTDARFPQLDGIRAYIVLGGPLGVSINSAGIPIAISADDPQSPNYDKTWDFIEATWHDDVAFTTLHVNTTQVDAFGLAFKVEHSGYDPANPSKPLTIVNGFDSPDARRVIFDEMSKAADPWKRLVLANKRRILMPLKSMDAGVFPKTQLDKYINDVVQYYRTNSLTFSYSGVDYTGTTDASGAFIFAPPKASGKPTYKFAKPTTRVCYTQDIRPTPDDGVGRAIGAALGASFLRSTLKFYEEFPVPQNLRRYYYREPPVCEYARIIHEQGINYHAFCYGYDEVAGDAGVNRDVRNPTSVKLTIQKA